MDVDIDWYKRAFNADYSAIYAHRDDSSALREVTWAMQLTGVCKHSCVLDLCCGNGRHSQHLAAQDYNVISVDLSRPLLVQAKKRAIDNAIFLCADMRFIPIQSSSLDAVFSFFTSFGYFRDDEDNASVIGEVARTLKSNGHLLFDFLNAEFVKNNLVPESEDHRDGTTLIQKRRITSDGKRVEKEITYMKGSAPFETYYESVRLYGHQELIDMFREHGLNTNGLFGGFQGTAYSPDTPRLIIHAQKEGL